VSGQIIDAQVCFHLDDQSRTPLVNQDPSEQVSRHDNRAAREEGFRERFGFPD
jgi:hypothetical protein